MSVPPDRMLQHLAAIVEGSDDAIIAKDLNSVIQSWNGGAERMFGYSAEEAIGRPITMLIPEDRQDEEPDFICRLRRGERISQYETVRLRKNGELFPISVTISPIRDESGTVVGASKIARDITLQHRLAEQQEVLLREMRHRVGNSFAIAAGLLRLCAQESSDVTELVRLMEGRFRALSVAHGLAVPISGAEEFAQAGTKLGELLEQVITPFCEKGHFSLELDDVVVSGEAVTALALIFYELATNSLKYGAFSQKKGRVVLRSELRDDRLLLEWSETFSDSRGMPEPLRSGYGTRLSQAAVESYLDGRFDRVIGERGMEARLDISMDRLRVPVAGQQAAAG